MMSCSRTSYGKASVLKPVQSDETDGIQVVVVHDLQLLPHYRPGLTLQQTQTSETKTRTRSFRFAEPFSHAHIVDCICNQSTCLPMFQDTRGAFVSAFLTDI